MARGGPVVAVCFGEVKGHAVEEIRLPKASPWTAPRLHLVVGQLLAYETAVGWRRNVDQPRSPAKSVTVA
ncbi:MAG TPA: hypothetical protein VNP04_10290 [Alphaproteobacteria bacterium]|nr:hypothetical protein [Alphaproteobacteria bacterium]